MNELAIDIGAELKNARIAQNKSLQDISAETRIAPHILEGLENNAPIEKPTSIYTIGHIRLYATCLDIDSTPLIQALNHASQSTSEDQKSHIAPNNFLQTHLHTIKKNMNFTHIVIILIVFGWMVFLWQASTHQQTSAPKIELKPAQTTAVPPQLTTKEKHSE